MKQALNDMLSGGGASLVGYADLSSLNGEGTKGFPFAVVMALALDPGIIARIPTGPHEEYSHEYSRVNTRLDELAVMTESWLRDKGFGAYAITTQRAPYDEVTCETDLPYKTVARLAGLGWIGKNALFVTREFGCAQRLSVVLTDAPLTPGSVNIASQCGSCTLCQQACPGGAIRGNHWNTEISRECLVDVGICQATTEQRGKELSVRKVTCGLCIAMCPFTKRYIGKSEITQEKSI